MLIIKILNDGTGTEEIGNYRYQVMVNDAMIEIGEIKNHCRADGWRILLKMLISISTRMRDAEIIDMVWKKLLEEK